MKPLSKINQIIVDLAIRIDEIESYDAKDDFNVRENMICANIKAYEWIDEDDVINAIKSYNLSEDLQDAILQEFNNDRLNNIWAHSCEDFVRGFKDELEDRCHINNLSARATAYHYYANDWEIKEKMRFYVDHYRKEFDKFRKRKHNTHADYLAYIRRNNSFDYEESERLNLISPEVWQYGRSGGWLSVCNRGILENCSFDGIYTSNFILHDNDKLNEELQEYQIYTKDKPGLIQDMKDFISEWEEKHKAVQHFVDRIEGAVKHFKEILIENLSNEISEYISQNSDAANCTITLTGELIETSLGVTVPASEFRAAFIRLMDELKTHSPGKTVNFRCRVGKYITEYAKINNDDIIVKAGCHRFSIKQVRTALAEAV